MRPIACCLIVLIAPVIAHATEDNAAGAPRQGCTYTPADADRAPTPSAPVSAPSTPVTNKALPSPRGGDEDLLPRVRSTQWHRFLPGMFR